MARATAPETTWRKATTLNFLKESIWFVRVENLVAVHHCDKILGVAKVNDVMCISRKHVHALDVVA